MPHYDYECKKCGYRFERFQKITDKPLMHCPKCKGSVRRLIGAGCGLIFKGSGFYATDYKKRKKPDESCPSQCPSKDSKKPAACDSNCKSKNPSKA